jgi:hypothetical protein
MMKQAVDELSSLNSLRGVVDVGHSPRVPRKDGRRSSPTRIPNI